MGVQFILCIDLQVDMRDFLNAPNGLPKQPLTVNERVESEGAQSPFGGRTVWAELCSCAHLIGALVITLVLFYCRMYLTFPFIWQEIKLKRTFEIRWLL